ncbi:MAG TPA: carboxypeptidase-like regulatory domain-containing protein [Vicinamibacterales bacterium]|nr:carboxypeptidase-like regulatory domain-containing protein [Vicinamibacterales bacterium]
MMRLFTAVLVLTVALPLAFSTTACDDGPTGPSAPPPAAAGPAPAVVTGLEMIGPDTIAPGESVQFKATASLSDGTTRDVTLEAGWQRGHPDILTVSSSGVVTGLVRGETWLSVVYGGKTVTRSEMLVLSAGTYRVRGTVRDAGFPVFGAEVEVIRGSATGLSTTSTDDYRLYGVSGVTELRVRKAGYHEQRKRLDVVTHHILDFDLELSAPRADIAGRYRLEVTASPECSGALPEEARIRTYTADIAQTGPRLEVTLSGASFRALAGRSRNQFYGVAEPGHPLTFRLDPGWFYYYHYGNYFADVVEQLDESRSLTIGGSVEAAPGSSRIAGVLDGELVVRNLQFTTLASCRSSRHQFVLAR